MTVKLSLRGESGQYNRANERLRVKIEKNPNESAAVLGVFLSSRFLPVVIGHHGEEWYHNNALVLFFSYSMSCCSVWTNRDELAIK